MREIELALKWECVRAEEDNYIGESMILILLAMGLGLATAGTLGFGITSVRLGKKVNKLTDERDRYKNQSDDLIIKLQDAQEENVKLLTDGLDSISENINADQMMHFIKNNVTKFAHHWEHMFYADYKNLGPKRHADILITEYCRCCGMVRRRWRDGDGAKFMKGYEGSFLGDKKINDEFRQVVCVGLLPLEFMSRKNSDLVKELVILNEEPAVNMSELEELIKSSRR